MDDDVEFVDMTIGGAIYILGTNKFFRIDSNPDGHEIILEDEVIASYSRLMDAEEAYRQASMVHTLGDVLAIFNAA